MKKTIKKMIDEEPLAGKKMLLALFGEQKHPLEISARTFLAVPEAMDWASAPDGFRSDLIKMVQLRLLADVCEALTKRDAEAFRSVAAFLKENDKPTDDPCRVAILAAKEMRNPKSPLLTFREFKAQIGYIGPDEVFRRWVDELGYPYKKLTGGRPRKTPAKKQNKFRSES